MPEERVDRRVDEVDSPAVVVLGELVEVRVGLGPDLLKGRQVEGVRQLEAARVGDGPQVDGVVLERDVLVDGRAVLNRHNLADGVVVTSDG